MTPRIVGFSIDFHMQLHDSPTARSRKQALAEQWNARIVWEIRTVIGGQHLHTWPASYLVIAAVISACPLSRHFYDKGCTPLLPRMKLRRSIACVHTPPPIPPPLLGGWITSNRKVNRSEQRFYPLVADDKIAPFVEESIREQRRMKYERKKSRS